MTKKSQKRCVPSVRSKWIGKKMPCNVKAVKRGHTRRVCVCQVTSMLSMVILRVNGSVIAANCLSLIILSGESLWWVSC